MAKMTWNPPPPEAIAAFAAATGGVRDLEPRKMFGYDAVFVNGNMAAGLHEVGMVLRLPDDDRERFRAEHEAKPFEVMGRVMREYVVVPTALLSDTATLTRWLRRSATYVATLPDKSKNRTKPAAKKKAAAKVKAATASSTGSRAPASKTAQSKTSRSKPARSKAARPKAAGRKSVPPKIAPGGKKGR